MWLNVVACSLWQGSLSIQQCAGATMCWWYIIGASTPIIVRHSLARHCHFKIFLRPFSHSMHPFSSWTVCGPVSHPFTCGVFSRSNGNRKRRFLVRGRIFLQVSNDSNQLFASNFNILFYTRVSNPTQYWLLHHYSVPVRGVANL